MDRKDLKLAAYLDEVGDDPDLACKTLVNLGILYVALRHVWSNNVCDMSNIGHKRLKKILDDNNISTILIASELGKTQKISTITDDQIDNAINICKYYNAPYFRIFLNYDTADIDHWLSKVSKKCVDNNITPLFELPDTQVCKPTVLAQLLSTHKNWRLLYDPASIIAKQNIDPFTRYWTLLKNHVSAIDIRDIKIGRGYKPAGFGDAKVNMTIKDAIHSNYNGWFIMEPSLGRKHGTAVTKGDTFQNALDGLEQILNSIGK